MSLPTISRMRIKEIQATASRVGRVRLLFDNDTKMMVYPSVVADLGLFSGMELDEKGVKLLEDTAARASAKERAVRIVAASSVSKSELLHRLLEKGERQEDAEQAVAWLVELKLLDDLQTAKGIVERGVRKGYGKNRLRQLLYEKRIPKQYWDEALSDVPEMDDAIDAFLHAKLDGKEIDDKLTKKTVDALLRRGHSYFDIKTALRRYSDELEDHLED